VLQERAREQLARRYKSSRMAEDVLLTALYSISDNNSFLLFNRDPITRMIQYLKVRICPHHTSAQPIVAVFAVFSAELLWIVRKQTAGHGPCSNPGYMETAASCRRLSALQG